MVNQHMVGGLNGDAFAAQLVDRLSLAERDYPASTGEHAAQWRSIVERVQSELDRISQRMVRNAA